MPAIPPPQSAREVKRVNNEYRNALLSMKYYACRLDYYRLMNKWFEGIIAVGASGSGVAGFALWKTDTGVYIWGIISAASIFLSVLKPIIGLAAEVERYSKLSTEYSSLSEVERYSKLSTEYSSLSENLRLLVDDIKTSGGITTEHVQTLRQLLSGSAERAARGDRNPKRDLVQRLEQEVIQETTGALPVEA